MENEDPGDTAAEAPSRNLRQRNESSERVTSRHSSIKATSRSKIRRAKLHDHVNSSPRAEHGSSIPQSTLRNDPDYSYQQQQALVQVPSDGTIPADQNIATTRMHTTTVIDGNARIEDEQNTRPLDLENQELEPSHPMRDLEQNSVSRTMRRRATKSQYAAIPPRLRRGRRQQSVPGVEQVGGSRLGIVRENSNESFGGNSNDPQEHEPAPHLNNDLLWVHAHLVEEPDSATLVVAKPMDDEYSLTEHTHAKNRHRRLMGAIACLVLVLVAVGVTIGIVVTGNSSDASSNSVSTNETSVVATFLEMLPHLIGPTSQELLSNPLSAQSQARLWVESLPIHNTMTIERLKQRYALVALFYATGDQLWCKSDKWLSASDECTWYSSSTEPVCTGEVYTNLDLSYNCLQNVPPNDLLLLSTLQILNLTGNIFTTGGFPELLYRLTSLTALSLGSCGFSGTIPERLKELSNLESLDITSNGLTGNITAIMALTGLKTLDFSGNSLSGSIPTEIGQLSNLEEWTNIGNYFQALPATELGASRGLDTMYRREGAVISGLPSEIGNLSNLRNLEISFSYVSGEIPSEISRLTKLESLKLYFNVFTGTIPDELFGMTNLEYLDLSNNLLTGTLSPYVDQMTSLRFLSFETNSLQGSLPTHIGSLTSLRQLGLSTNQFNGTIPSEVGNLEDLLYLSLHMNHFVGSIPTQIGKLEEVSELYLSSNNLSGTIPTEFGNLLNLTSANLDNTNLVMPVPSELGLLRNLYSITLFNTSMVGSMPAEVCEDHPVGYLILVNCDSIFKCECCSDWYTMILCMNDTSTDVPTAGGSV